MKNGDQPAFARPYSHDERPSGGHEGDRVETFQSYDGLTKREYFAAMAMQGLCSPYFQEGNQATVKETTVKAVEIADELLKQLES